MAIANGRTGIGTLIVFTPNHVLSSSPTGLLVCLFVFKKRYEELIHIKEYM